MPEFPTDRHGLIHRSAARAAGYSDNELSRAERRGLLTRVIRGVFVVRTERDQFDAHRLFTIATYIAGGSSTTISHQSAGVLHGLSMLKPDLTRVHLTTTGTGRIDKRRHLHVGQLADDEVTTIEGIPVTSIERTAVDIACASTMGFAGALAGFDSALRNGADRERMAQMLTSRRPGIAHARRAPRYADNGAENAGESWGRAQMIEAGLPLPRLQHEFYDNDGRKVARTDYDRVGLLVAEFDGMVKYQKHLRPGESPFDAMRREKQREDDLRRLGVMVIRWTWADLENGRVVGMVREWLERLGLLAA
ncbi:type IV toxin-antitoxin system AbiEi family antitoxin domain-containing protein [Gordonia sp. NPDC003424]